MSNHVRGVQLIIIHLYVLHVHKLFQSECFHRVRSSASSFNFQYPVFSLRSSSSCLSLLPLFPLLLSLPVSLFQLRVLEDSSYEKCDQYSYPSFFFIVRRLFVSLTLCITSSFLTQPVHLISILLQHHTSKLPRYLCLVSEVSEF